MHFLITAGGTREYIDPVRFISNASSGRMGYALARAALKVGHKVILITAPTNLRKPAGAKVVDVETSAQMCKAVKADFENCDCLIMAAAVSDYTPAKVSRTKIKKTDQSLAIKLKPTTDILKWAGRNKGKARIVAGFALEDKNLRRNAEKKLTEKNLDMIIANAPTAIGREKSTVEIKTPHSDWAVIANASKAIIAKGVVMQIAKLALDKNLTLPADHKL